VPSLQHLVSGTCLLLETRRPVEGFVQRYLDRCPGEPCIRSKSQKLTKNETRIKLDIPIGLAHGELTPRTFGRSWGSRWFGRWIIDLDPTRLLGHDLLSFL
jgi:hypothetical protein